jgi:hypothetical protein
VGNERLLDGMTPGDQLLFVAEEVGGGHRGGRPEPAGRRGRPRRERAAARVAA